MSTPSTNKKQYSPSEMSARFAGYLDKKDGKTDNQISQEDWNCFAEYTGLDPTEQTFVTTEDAMAGIDSLIVSNPEKLVNYSRDYLGRNITMHQDESAQVTPAPKKNNDGNTGATVMKDSLITSALNTMAPGSGVLYPLVKHSKKITDFSIEKFIQISSVDTIQTCVQTASDMTSYVLPMASELLHISATPSELTVGRHSGYSVLSPSQSKTKLAALGMHENDTNVYGRPNEHLTSEQMKLKTVVFDSSSDMSKGIGQTALIRAAIQCWEADGRPAKKYYGGTMNETSDCLMAINSCLITVNDVKENGSTLTYSGYVEDVYDFADSYKKQDSIKDKVVDTINKAAYHAQEKGAIQKYRVLVPFTVTLSKSG